jgi:hypothetical protein
MKVSLRSLALLSILSSLLAVGLSAYPALAEEMGTDFWHVGELWARKSAAEESMRRLQREDELVMRRIAFKQEIVRDLLDGRIGFEEAASRFADLHRSDAVSMAYLRSQYPGETDENRAEWLLVRYLKVSEDRAAHPIAEEWACILSARQE